MQYIDENSFPKGPCFFQILRLSDGDRIELFPPVERIIIRRETVNQRSPRHGRRESTNLPIHTRQGRGTAS